MTNKARLSTVSAAIILSASLLFCALTVSGQRSREDREDKDASKESSAEIQWEYLVVSGGNINVSTSGNDSSMRKQTDFSREAYPLERNLDKLGSKGWELVAVHGSPVEPVFYLKRRKESR